MDYLIDYILIITLNVLCIIAAINDVKTRKIPNWISLTLFIIWLVSIILKWILADLHILNVQAFDVLADSGLKILSSAIVSFILLLCIFIIKKAKNKQQDIFGMGDIKLVMVICLYFGFSLSLICLLIACLGFIFYICILRIRNNKQLTSAPFAPFILFGTMFVSIIYII